MRKYLIILALGIMAFLPSTGAFAQTKAENAQTIDKKNLVVKEWNTDTATNRKYLDHVTTWNADGRKAEEKEYDMQGLKWTKRYEYDAQGRTARELTYNAQGRLDNVKKFEYNDFGKKKAEYTYDAKGHLKRTKTYEYIISK